MKIKELIEAATGISAANVGTVVSPHLAIGKARGKKSYTGSPGKSGTKAPKPPLPKKQTPKDNALNMKGTSIFGGPAIDQGLFTYTQVQNDLTNLQLEPQWHQEPLDTD